MLEVENLTKYYGDLLAVDEISFRIEEGELVTLLGPSGCGKSTTLHMIAGLTTPTAGEIHLRDVTVTDLPPDERNIGMVFQSSATFPHMTVGENIEYGLKMHGFDSEQTDDRIRKYLELVQMAEYRDHKPTQLSGGQERRVSLARSLAYEPDILLLDEPLTGLDRVLREDMRNEIKRIQREVGVTTLYVTHDQEEALSLSDEVVVMQDGRKQQEGPPKAIYERPANEFVAEFVGKSTKFEGTIHSASPPTVETDVGRITVERNPRDDLEVGRDLLLYVRPESVRLSHERATGDNSFAGAVTHVEYLGTYSEIGVTLNDGTTVLVHANPSFEGSKGDDVYVSFDPSDVIVL